MSGKRRSRQWRKAHAADPYVRKAAAAGYRSRAAFKLLELDAAERLFAGARVVVDLGAAPGGWTQVACERVAPAGRVLAIDLLEMAPVEGAEILRGDFTDPDVRAGILARIGPRGADLVISDMAPNLSGVRIADRAASEALVAETLEFCAEALKPNGKAVVKVFQSPDLAVALASARSIFRKVRLKKPSASRSSSAESYLLATGRDGILQQ